MLHRVPSYGYDCCTVLEGRTLCTLVCVVCLCVCTLHFVCLCVLTCTHTRVRSSLVRLCACAPFACTACVQPGYVYEHAWARVLLGSGCVYERASLWNGLRYSAVLALRRPRGAAGIDHLFGSRGGARVACPARLAVRRRRRLPSQPAGLFSERTVLFCVELAFGMCGDYFVR